MLDRDAVHEPLDLHVRALHLRDMRPEKREADFIASTDAIDSYGERVEQSWDLDRFRSNPVVLWAHQSRELPIGHAKNIRVVDGQLQATIVFASEKANPKAEHVYQSVIEGTLRAVSVGFMPREVHAEKLNGKDVICLSNNDLFEISVTPIPANPEALAKARAKAFATAQLDLIEVSNVEELTKAKEALEESTKTLDAERSKVKALETQTELLVKERDAAVARADKAERGLVEAEVEALIGVKFSRDEKDAQVELALHNRTLFDKLAAQRSMLPSARDIGGEGAVIGAEPEVAVRASVTDDNGASLEAAVQKARKAS
jgi:HK97 family phage prohead protease